MAPENCKGDHIFGGFVEPTSDGRREWKPITNCIRKRCMIPAKGIRVLARSCKPSVSQTLKGQLLNNRTDQNPSLKRSRMEYSLKICEGMDNLREGCSKLITPSQYASSKCAKYKVKFSASSNLFNKYLILWQYMNTILMFYISYMAGKELLVFS